MRSGWFRESHRHSLAARGIRTSFKRRGFDEALHYVGEVRGEVRPVDFPSWEEEELRNRLQSPLTQQVVNVGGPEGRNRALWLAVGDPHSSDVRQLAFAHWDASLLKAPVDYGELLGKVQPYVERKAAEHGQLSKQAYIKSQLDAIKRRRINEALGIGERQFISASRLADLPEGFVPISPSPGRNPGGLFEITQDEEGMRLLRRTKPYIVSSGNIEREFPEGLTARDFEIVRVEGLSPAFGEDVYGILEKEYESGKLKVPGEYASVPYDYLEELKSGNRPLTAKEANVVFSGLYKKNKSFHGEFDKFKMMAALSDAARDPDVVRDPKKAQIIFDQILSAQHMTGAVLPYDIPSLRKQYLAELMRNEAKASRSWVKKKGPVELIKGGRSSGMKPGDFDQKELAKGVKVEMEHTDNKLFAREIAMDHLAEFPGEKYYSELDKMERRLKSPSLGGKK